MPGDLSTAFFANFVYGQALDKLPIPTASFAGETVIVTGSNTGLACRSAEKGEAAKKSIVESTKCNFNGVEVWSLDLGSYASVKAFAARATRDLPRIDVQLENAGVAMLRWDWTENNETSLTVNVVSTFLLGFLLLPKLKETAAKFNTRPNLTFVVSDTHFFVDFKEKNAPEGIFNHMNDKSISHNMDERYPNSKLMEVLIIREMAARRSVDSYPVTINMLNPGLCESELAREGNMRIKIMKFLLARTTEQGSRTLVHAAAAGRETHGEYLNMCKVTPTGSVTKGPEGQRAQKRLWDELMAKLDEIEPGVSGNLRDWSVVLQSRTLRTSAALEVEASTDIASSTPETSPPLGVLDPNIVSSPRLERKLVRTTGQQPIGSRRRRVALQNSRNIPFEQLPYQCFQEARKVLLADREEKLKQIEEERHRIAKTQAIPATQYGGEWIKKGRLVRMQKYLEKLKILADINDPVIKKRFEDGQGDMNRPIYRYLADQQWRKQRRLILMQRINQMHIVPDVLPYLNPTAEVKLAFGRRTVQPGAIVDSLVSEKPPWLHVQVFDKGDRLISIAVIDPDVPNVETDGFDSRCHFLAVNVPISPSATYVALDRLGEGTQVLRPWLPPYAQKGSPYHRLVVLIYEQKGGNEMMSSLRETMSSKAKDNFRLNRFTRNLQEQPIAVHLFRTIWDDNTAGVMQRAGIEGANIELKRKKAEKLPYKKKDGASATPALSRQGLMRPRLDHEKVSFFNVHNQSSTSTTKSTPSSKKTASGNSRHLMGLFFKGATLLGTLLLLRSAGANALTPRADALAVVTNAQVQQLLGPQLSQNASIYFPSSPQFANLTDRWSTFTQGDIALVVEPATTQDVAAAVKLANKLGLPFLAVNGAHGSTSSLNTIQRGVSINLRNFNQVQISQDGQSALIGGGANTHEVVNGLGAHGKVTATTNGGCTGQIGPGLGGGFGRYMGYYGLILDNILDMTVVLANGDVQHTSPTSNSDLYWGMKGAGQNFGIVTEANFKIYDYPTSHWVYAEFTYADTEHQLGPVFEAINEINTNSSQPKELGCVYTIFGIDQQYSKTDPIMRIQFSYAGTLEQAQPWLDIFTNLHPASWWKNDSLLPTEIQPAASQDSDSGVCKFGSTWRLFPVGLKAYNITANRQVYDLYKQLVAEHPEFSGSVAQFENYAQEGMRAVDPVSTAYPHRDDAILVSFAPVYAPSEASDAIAFDFGNKAREIWHAGDAPGRQWTAYLNYANGDEPTEAVYGYESWRLEKLRGLKEKYDPQNKFRFYNPLVR
ncbi:MAG: hypothetical protein LQ338_003258 [Usnochroma carphineum]|nr:MAG: hypothetical protein LQ338_003258 [Usnochroma carphineum]